MTTLRPTAHRFVLTAALLSGAAGPYSSAQDTAEDEEVFVLSPFEVTGDDDAGYRASSTLAGTRIRTDLKDIGSAISVYTDEFLNDVQATNNESLLLYATNVEVGGPRGNFSGGVQEGTYREQDLFANPNANTRVRGLTSADNTRNYFLTDIPWDGYTVSRVDIQRGPNGILFGLGSPAGVINATTQKARFENGGSFEAVFDRFGSQRYVADYNLEVLDEELAARVSVLRNDQEFQQKPAYALDERVYAAINYRPRFLNTDTSRFDISGNYERGNIDSNRPRIVTPGDYFSGYWEPESAGGVGGRTFNPFTTDYSTTTSPDYTQALGGAGLGDVVLLVNSNRPDEWAKDRVDAWGAITPDGAVIETRISDTNGPYPRGNSLNRVGIRNYSEWAAATGLPFGSFGGYNARTITDPSIFDFYDRLIDGPNKGEWTDWDVFDVSVSQTFLDNAIGYELSHFRQNLDRGQWSVMGWTNEIYMDINEANSLGVPNPDVGRAYVQIESRDGGNGSVQSDRDATRLQLFGEYDFQERGEGLWARILGLHRVTGVMSEENQRQDARVNLYADLDYETKLQLAPRAGPYGDELVYSGFRYYISDDLRGRGSPAGADLGNMSMRIFDPEGGPARIRYFDTTWIAGDSVDPAAPWENPNRPGDTFTQSNNPANYQGWSDLQGAYVTSRGDQTVLGMPARDYLTTGGVLSDFDVESKALVWQGFFWDRAIIGTYGYREDEARSYIYSSSARNGTGREETGGADLRPETYNYRNPDGAIQDIETTTRNWSVAAHLNRLLGERDFLPIDVSIYYNQGENFQPLAGRIDAFAQPLEPPSGSTKEYSLLLATKDGRYSLRATRYDTTVLNGNSTGSIGAMWALEQTLSEGATTTRNYRAGRADYQSYEDAGGDPDFLRDSIMATWFQFEKDLAAQFPEFIDAWMGGSTPFGTDDDGDVSVAAPAGFSYTEDSTSEGYEFEFTATPTDNLRIALNASKTEATRTNVPGTAFKTVAAFIDDAIQNTDAGLAPMWWDQNVDGGRNVGPWTIFRPDYLKNAALNGQSAGEVRKWRANAIANYDFRDGPLGGLGVGGGYRWEDRAVVDYAPMVTSDGDNAVNLEAPFYADAEESVDLWVSYTRALTDRVDWKIQLNVFNAFGENELVPIAASVDHQALEGVEITPDTEIPMQASAFTIRQGMSWSLSNTFAF